MNREEQMQQALVLAELLLNSIIEAVEIDLAGTVLTLKKRTASGSVDVKKITGEDVMNRISAAIEGRPDAETVGR